MNHTRRQTRHNRARAKIKGTAKRPRVSIFRSARILSLQFINDENGQTLLAVASKPGKKTKVEQALAAGQEAAAAAKKQGISKVIFDRSGYAYHGRVKAVADALREGGLDF